jgi:hypothetical protein
MAAEVTHASLIFGVLMFVSIVSMIFTLEYLDDEVFENSIPDFKFQRVLVGAVVSSILSAMVHRGVTRQNQEGSWVLMSMLLISQLVCCVNDNYAASASLREGFASGMARRRVDMWLGKRLAATAIALIVAEELGVPWESVTVDHARPGSAFSDMGTAGSDSVAGRWVPLRNAAAAAREPNVRLRARGSGGGAAALAPLRDACERDLAKALPAYDAAVEALKIQLSDGCDCAGACEAADDVVQRVEMRGAGARVLAMSRAGFERVAAAFIERALLPVREVLAEMAIGFEQVRARACCVLCVCVCVCVA